VIYIPNLKFFTIIFIKMLKKTNIIQIFCPELWDEDKQDWIVPEDIFAPIV